MTVEIRERTREAMLEVFHCVGDQGWIEREMAVLKAPRTEERRHGLG